MFDTSFSVAITGTHSLNRLLGLSAFSGFVVLLIGWPLNNWVARRAVRIHKGLSTARDKRMGVLNELITAVSRLRLDYSLAK